MQVPAGARPRQGEREAAATRRPAHPIATSFPPPFTSRSVPLSPRCSLPFFCRLSTPLPPVLYPSTSRSLPLYLPFSTSSPRSLPRLRHLGRLRLARHGQGPGGAGTPDRPAPARRRTAPWVDPTPPLPPDHPSRGQHAAMRATGLDDFVVDADEDARIDAEAAAYHDQVPI